MSRYLTLAVVASGLLCAASPAFAQEMNLDPFHIFTPAPSPAPMEATPAAMPTMRHHRHGLHCNGTHNGNCRLFKHNL